MRNGYRHAILIRQDELDGAQVPDTLLQADVDEMVKGVDMRLAQVHRFLGRVRQGDKVQMEIVIGDLPH